MVATPVTIGEVIVCAAVALILGILSTVINGIELAPDDDDPDDDDPDDGL